jgi:hypothetical protein
VSTDVTDCAALPVVRLPHGIEESKCVVCQGDRHAAERASQPDDSEPQDSLASILLLDSATGRAIVETTCAQFGVSVAQLWSVNKIDT